MAQDNRKYLDQVGSFECRVEEPQLGWIGESSEKKTPFVRIPLVVTEGEDIGKTCVYQAWLSDGAFDNTVKRLKEVFGFDGDFAALHAKKVSLAGLPCNITTESETYDGKTRLKIAWLNVPGGGGGTPMEDAKVTSILGKLNSRAKAIAKTVEFKGSLSAAEAIANIKGTSPTGGVVSDDVPF